MNWFSSVSPMPMTVTSTMSTTMGASESKPTTYKEQKSDATTLDASSSLGKDDFLRLLVTQLTYQDPINPVADQEFIAQLAQFSALEQMYNVAAQIERLADIQLLTGGMGQAACLCWDARWCCLTPNLATPWRVWSKRCGWKTACPRWW